jgi:hypothetical protein
MCSHGINSKPTIHRIVRTSAMRRRVIALTMPCTTWSPQRIERANTRRCCARRASPPSRRDERIGREAGFCLQRRGSRASVRSMTPLKLLVLAAGIAGAIGLFLPLQPGHRGSMWDAVVALQHGKRAVDRAHVRDVRIADGVTTRGVQRDVGLLVRLLQLWLLAMWLPSITLACVGVRALVRRDFGRVAGLVAIAAGALNLVMGWPPVPYAPGAALVAASGLVGVIIGLIVLVHPERSRRLGKLG